MEYDRRRVNAAVKVRIQIDRYMKKRDKFLREGRHSQADLLLGKISALDKDLARLKGGMTAQELTEYVRRFT